ncbi:hypothetical protein AAFP35_15600 [Gordonia sp. CPCC 206044]|uniref:hypothetical protein n=1 Tax=Gordonia sp. CPCC 206044 TaxID=3140793 RepID=UPI003AF37F2D
MTVTDAAPAPSARGPGLRERLPESTAVVVFVRWAFILAATVFGFWETLVAVAREMSAGTLISYLPAAIVLVIIAAIGVSWRRGAELPIRDRQTDVIVGAVILLVALVMDVANRRYSGAYLTTHIDLLALWAFVLGSCCLAFGLRPVARYRWVWLLGLIIFPVPYRLIVLSLGGSPTLAGLVMVVFGAFATAVAVGRTAMRAFVGGCIAAAVGVLILVFLRVVFPDAAQAVLQTLPALGAALVASALLYVDYHRRQTDSWSPLGRRLIAVSVPRFGRPALLILVIAIAMFFVPTPAYGRWADTYVPGLDTRPPLIVPSGWSEGAVAQYNWVSRLYGPGAVMFAQDLFQTKGSLEFDKFARSRKVVANTVETANPLSFDVYPIFFVYDLVGARFSAPVAVSLPHGVTGYLQTVVNDTNYLTYNRLYWSWTDGNKTQRVILISVDNHEPDAAFPSPNVTVLRNLNTFFTVLFRGNSVTVDLEPQLKDRDLLVGLATDLIDTQVDAIDRASS